MADSKLTALTDIGANVDGNDLLYVVDDPSGTPASRKATVTEVVNAAGGLVLIQEQILVGDSASVTFSTIPQIYRHLELWITARVTEATTNDYIRIRFNGDTAAHYDFQHSTGTGTSNVTSSSMAQTSLIVANVPGTSAARSTQAGCGIARILHYTNTTWEKQVLVHNASVWDTTAGAAQMDIEGGAWRSAAAITQIDLIPAANNIKAGSIFTLYGVR